MPMLSSRRALRALPALLLALGVLAAPSGAQTDAEARREEVQRERAAVAAEIDTLEATDEEVEAALRALEDNVAARTGELREAERQASAAEAAVEAATARVRSKEAEIAVLDQAMKQAVVEAYMQPTSSMRLIESLSAGSIGEAELKQSLLEARSSNELDALDQLTRAREDLEVARAQAERAAAEAEDRQAQVSAELAAVSEARDEQASVVVRVQERLDRRLAEARSLADLDSELAAEIEAEQARIAAELARQQAAEEAAQEAAREAAARDAAAREAAEASTPRTTRPAAPSPAPAPQPTERITVPITGSGSIVSVGGIRVHQSIAGNLRSLLEAAAADGIRLAGGGYRDPAGQIATRRANCGSSNYAVYQMPASSCRPPTARPGTSMHERGLAVDFTYQGRIIGSRSSAAFQWLRANATRYGLYNLPSEPWHWSVNGR